MVFPAVDAWFYQIPGDPRLAHLPLMGSPLATTAIVACYIYFVTSLGPRLMKHRKPFDLRHVLTTYNLCMVILSITQFIRGGMYGWFGSYSYSCQPIDYSNSRDGLGMAYTAYIYFVSKIIEMLDTVFFVMRKKFKQITLLHVTHHASVAWLMYWGVKYFPGGHGSFQGFANSFVHIFVYSYYLLAALGPQFAPFLWWKRYLTQLQMIQFVVIFLHTFQLVFRPDCPYPRWILVPYCGVAAYFLLMFVSFYSRSYSKAEAQAARDEPSKQALDQQESTATQLHTMAQRVKRRRASDELENQTREQSLSV